MSAPRVLKFGGSSLATPARVRLAVARLRAARAEAGASPVVAVVSAFAGTTDELVALAGLATSAAGTEVVARVAALAARHREALAALAPGDRAAALAVDAALAALVARLVELERDGRALPAAVDAVLATGERLAAPIVAAALRAAGEPARAVDAGELVRTDAGFGNGVVDLAATAALCRRTLAPALAAGELPVVPGFFGADAAGRTVLLGRGGSDTTATVLGAALHAQRVEIWTDVPGVLSADPRLVVEAVPLAHLGYGEAEEMALHGARVLHARSLAPAREARVPIVVRDSFAPLAGADAGTLVDAAAPPSPSPVRAVATLAAPLPEPLASWIAVRALVPRRRRDTVAAIALVGAAPGLAPEVGEAVAAHGGPALAAVASASGRSLVVLVESGRLAAVATALHRRFVLGATTSAADAAAAPSQASAAPRSASSSRSSERWQRLSSSQ